MVSNKVRVFPSDASLGTSRIAHALVKWVQKLRPDLDTKLIYGEQYVRPRFGSGNKAGFRTIQENPLLSAIYNHDSMHPLIRKFSEFNTDSSKYVAFVKSEPDSAYILCHDMLAKALSKAKILGKVRNSIIVNDTAIRPNHAQLVGAKQFVLPVYDSAILDILRSRKASSKAEVLSGYIVDPILLKPSVATDFASRAPLKVTFAFSGGGINPKTLKTILDGFSPKIDSNEIRLTVACSTESSYNFCRKYFENYGAAGIQTFDYDAGSNFDGLFQRARSVDLLWRENTEDLERLVVADGNFMNAQYEAIQRSDVLFIPTPSELSLVPNIPIYIGPQQRGPHERANAIHASHAGYAVNLKTLENIGARILFDSRNGGKLATLRQNSMTRAEQSQQVVYDILKGLEL